MAVLRSVYESKPEPVKPRRQPAPPGLQLGGRAFWRAIVTEFELVDHELVILKEACRTIDLLDSLQGALDSDGPLQSWGEGVRQHPAVPATRDHRIALARLLAALGIPGDEEDQPPRGSRGVYRPGRS
jgi:hypothetical protein